MEEKVSILVVEDEENIRSALTDFLEFHNFEVTTIILGLRRDVNSPGSLHPGVQVGSMNRPFKRREFVLKHNNHATDERIGPWRKLGARKKCITCVLGLVSAVILLVVYTTGNSAPATAAVDQTQVDAATELGRVDKYGAGGLDCFAQMRAVFCPIVSQIPVMRDWAGQVAMAGGFSCPTTIAANTGK